MKRLASALALTAAVAAVATAGAPAASAATFTGCTPVTGGQTYLSAYGDTHSYVVAPGGNFSTSSTPWSPSRAFVSASNQSTANVTGSSATGALSISAGGSAAAPQMCLASKDERLRFFYKAPAGTSFKVKTASTSSLGTYTVNTTVTAPTSGWNLTPEILVPDWTDGTGTQLTHISISNTSLSATVLVDDVLVDPWRSRGW